MATLNAFNHLKKKPWIIPFLMIAILTGPLFFAWHLVKKQDIHQFKQTQHGTLITAMPNLNQKLFYDVKTNQPFIGDELSGKWWLLYLGPTTCDANCLALHQNLHQIRTALGKDSHRVERLYICDKKLTAAQCFEQMGDQKHPSRLATLDARSHLALFGAIAHSPKQGELGEVYIVDPKGNIMMQYEPDVKSKDILSDLKRLLRVSKNG